MDRRTLSRHTRRAFLGLWTGGLAAGSLGALAGVSGSASQDTRTLMPGTAQETTLYINDSGVEGPTAFVVGGVHGDEEAGYLAGRDLQDVTPPWGRLVVLPRANIVAINGDTREDPNGDLNRQFPLDAEPETALAREMWDQLASFDPDLVVDMHEARGRYRDGYLGQTLGYAPVTDRGGAGVAIDAVNGLAGTENVFAGRYLPSPSEAPHGVLVQKSAYELGVPTYIVETYEDLDLTDRVRWHRAFVARLFDHRAWRLRAQAPRHTVELVGSGAGASFEFSVGGSVYATDTVDGSDSVGDDTVRGQVGDGETDHYQYTGRISSFSVTEGDPADLAVYVDGEAKTVDELDPNSTSRLTVSGSGQGVDYQFSVDGAITATSSREDHDRVFDDRAFGRVEDGSDTYEYGRDVDAFAITEGSESDVSITVDGDVRTIDELDETPTRELWVRGSGSTVRFAFAVSGTVVSAEATESGDEVYASSAEGRVGSDDDTYRFTGEVVSFTVLEGDPADVAVYVDGNETSVADLNPDAVHELRVEGTGTETGFAFEASDLVYPTSAVQDDAVGVRRAEGSVTSGTDRYLFRDEIVSFAVTDGSSGNVDLYVDGQQTTAAALNGSFSEARSLAVDDPWRTYDLTASYDAPVVIAKPPSYDGTQPCHTRLRSVTDAGFDCRVEEWLYLNGSHLEETTGSLAVETGAHTLGDGTRIEVGRVVTDVSWAGVSFDHEFPSAPVVLTQAQTERGWHSVVTRVRNLSAGGFEVRLQEEEAQGGHYHETVGYVAVDPGTGTLDGAAFEAGTTPDEVDEDWYRITFEREYANPVFLAGVESFDGSNPCAVRHRNLTGSGVEVRLEEEQSADGETGHTTESVSYLVVEGSPGEEPTSGLDASSFEARALAVDDPWRTYDLANAYDAPVVVAKPPSYDGTQPCHTRLQSVTGSTFDCRVEEWLYLNGSHFEETAGSVAIEAGSYELSDGRRVESGVVETDESWAGVTFDGSLSAAPVVLTQAQTERGWHSVVTRVRDVSTGGFEVRLQEEEAQGGHYDEAIGYVAVEPGVGSLAGAASEAGVLADGVDEQWRRISFEREYADPVFLAGVQSFDGSDTCGLRYRNLTGSSVEVRVEEERSVDDETGHATEDVGYLVVEG